MKNFVRRFLFSVLLLLPFVAQGVMAQFSTGNVIHFVNRSSGKAVSANSGGKVVGATADKTDYMQLWYVESGGSTCVLRNLGNGKYLRGTNDSSVQWETVASKGTSTSTYDGDGDGDSETWTFTTSLKVCSSDGYFTLAADPDSETTECADWYYDKLHYSANDGTCVSWLGADGSSGSWVTVPASWWTVETVSGIDVQAQWNKIKTFANVVNNKNTYQNLLDNLFTNSQCTTLKSEFQEEADLVDSDPYQQLPDELKEMALKVCRGDYSETNRNNSKVSWSAAAAKRFRVQAYEPHSVAENVNGIVKTNCYSNMNNPTGVYGDAYEVVYIMVGSAVPSGASLSVATISDDSEDYLKGLDAISKTTLSEGLNMIPIYNKGSLLYILYCVNSQSSSYPLSSFDPIEIQIAGGSIRGMYELGVDSDIYTELKANAEANNMTYYDVLSEKLAFRTSYQTVFKGGSDLELQKGLKGWDEMMLTQHLVMGIKTGAGDYTDPLGLHTQSVDYSNVMNNRLLVHSKASIGAYTQMPYRIQFAHGESWLTSAMDTNTAIWVPAHEAGHVNQNLINMIGMTEISNNLFSNVAVFYQDALKTRGGTIADNNADHINGTAWHFRDADSRMRMLYQLWLYYHAAGRNKNFYPELFRLLRNDPMSFHDTYTSSATNYTSTEALKFYKYACQAAGEDLTPFFEAWGFFVPFSQTTITDYYPYPITNLQTDINNAKTTVAGYGYTKNYAILFIEDRVGSTKPWNWGGTEGSYGDRGKYSDYKSGNSNDPSGEYTFTISQGNRVVICSDSNQGAGYVIKDGSGNIVAYANSDNFEVTEAIAANLKSGTYTLTVYGTTLGKEATAIDVANSNSPSAKRVALGVMLENVKALLDLTDATNTKVGYYKSSYAINLQKAYDEGYADFVDNVATDYQSDIELLNAEYDLFLSKGDYVKVGVVNGSAYKLQNSAKFEDANQSPVELSMAVAGNDVDGVKTSNVDTQRWIFEATGTEGYYYIKNKSKQTYVGAMTQNSVQVTAKETTTATAGKYRVVVKAPGLVALVDENDRALHVDASFNVVGWNDEAQSSQWYMTAVELNDLGLEKEELDALIGETTWAMNEMVYNVNISNSQLGSIKSEYASVQVDGVAMSINKVWEALYAVQDAQYVSNSTSSTAVQYASAYEKLLIHYYNLMGYYNTATGVNLDVEKEALQEAIDAVQSYLNSMSGGSGASKVTLTTTSGQPGYVSSNADQNAINYPDRQDGDGLPGLIDNNSNYLTTYFHSQWYGTNTGGAHYIQVDLGAGNELANFKFNYSTRSNPHAIPSEIVISGSTDGVSFTPIKTLNKELPGGKFYTPTADYSLNSNYATASKSNTRLLTGVKLQSPKYGEKSASLTNNQKIYNDLTSTVFKAAPGETLTATFTGDNCWMNGFVYIDEDNNGFTAGVNGYTPTGDLKTYSFYSGDDSSDSSGKNSAGSSISGDNRNVLNPPTFKAPTTPGLYRMRYKMDWNSIDPKGDVNSTHGTLLSNNGYIIDVLLEVRDEVSGAQTYESDVISTGAFYRYLRFTVTESACWQSHSCTGITHTSNGNTYYCFALADFGLTRITESSVTDTWVSADLLASAQADINNAQTVLTNAKTAIELVRETEAMEALLAELKSTQQMSLPVKLSTSHSSPYLYQVETKEVNSVSGPVWQYDTSATTYTYYAAERNYISNATADVANTNQFFYFMKGTETGQVYVYPYDGGQKLLAVDETMYGLGTNARIYSYAKDDVSNYVQEWTFADCGDGYFNMRPVADGTGYYVAMAAQLAGTYKLGFKNNGSDANTKFRFNAVKLGASEDWNTLNNYVTAHPEVPGSTQLFATSMASANAYNTLRREAVALLETSVSDEALTEMYNNLVAAYESLADNQPSAEKLYYIRSASTNATYKDAYVYNAGTTLKWSTSYDAKKDLTGVWVITPKGGNEYTIRSHSDMTQYWTNFVYASYTNGDCVQTTNTPDNLSITLIEGTNGQVNIYHNNASYNYAAYNVAASNNVVQTGNTKGTAGNEAAFYIEELPKDVFANLKSCQLTMTHWGYAGLYLDFTTVLPETMEAYVITEEEFDNVETEGSTVTATVVLRRLDCPDRVLPANTGVILKSNVDLEEDAIMYHTFEPADMVYSGNAELVSANKLKGSAVTTFVSNKTNTLDFYVFGVKNGKVGLYKALENYKTSTGTGNPVGDKTSEQYYMKCSANKIYYQTAQGALRSASGSSRLKFRFAGPDEEFVTDIENVETELIQDQQPEAVYDLQGRRVERIVAPGLYIVNGKKRYVKAAKF
ncbi:MAG: M60 family metallopeptidase [Bacteroidaceae bacterium]|nr:M60 family metallopeptidase [Bacteroidaceae bacterium]